MKKRSVVAIAILIVLALLAAIIWWFWSLGNLPAQAAPKLQLAVENGSVFITKAGSQMEEKATSGMELKTGDRIRTADGSVASIMAYGRADVRLAEKTTLTINEASGGSGTSYVMRWKLESGRVWSRILRLLDLDSAFQGQANQVIATVRGTAFGMVNDGSSVRLVVDHAGLAIKNNNQSKPEFVIGGQWADYSQQNDLLQRGDIASSTWSSDGWRNDNRSSDQRYTEAAMSGMVDGLGAKDGIAPDNWAYGLAQWSEKMHLSSAGQKAPDLWARYTGRKLGYIYDLIQRGKSGLAFQKMTEVENDLDNVLGGPQAKEYRLSLRPIVGRALLAVSDVDPNSNLYRLKLRIEDMYANLWSDDPAQTFYAHTLSVDSRLDEAERFDCSTLDQEQIKEAVNAVEQGLAREKTDWTSLQTSLSADQKDILTDKMSVQNLRHDLLVKRLADCSQPQTNASNPTAGSPTSTVMTTTTIQTTTTKPTTSNQTSVQAQSPTSTKTPINPTKASTQPPTNPPTQSSLGLTKIELYANPNPANVGETVSLYVKGYKADGSSLDVTSRATFSTSGGLGSLSETSFVAAKVGSGSFTATVADNGQSFTARAPLTVGEPVTLSRISIAPAGGTMLAGSSKNLTVTAYYSSGFSKDVTGNTKWSVSNTLASISGSTLAAGKTPGSFDVTAQYTEGGVTKDTLVSFSISLGATNLQ